MKILIIRLSSIGDILLTTPLLRCLRKAHPKAEVHYLTFDKNKDLLACNPHIDQVISFQKTLFQTYQLLKSNRYDYIIDLHNNMRSTVLKNLLFVKYATLKKENYLKNRIVLFKNKTIHVSHIVSRYIDTAKALNVVEDHLGLEFYFPDTFIEPPLLREKYIVVVAGALKNTKQLPIQKLIDICKNVKIKMVLLGGKDEISRGSQLCSEIGDQIINLCGKTNFFESAFYIKNASLVLTHDTGMMHLASAFKKIIFSVWGNTVPAFGMSPYKPNAQNVIYEVENISCRPCSRIGYAECPKKHFDCMQKQDTARIASDINAILSVF